MDRYKGTVKWFDCNKGFGFIAPDDGGDDLFVHSSSIKAVGLPSLYEGEPVEFSVALYYDGRTCAFNVTDPGEDYSYGWRDTVGSCDCCGMPGHFPRECPNALHIADPPFFPPLSSKMIMGFSSEEEDGGEEEPPTGVEERNWADLPQDVLLLIFQKIAAVEIIRSAQFVCRPWRQLSREPELWRCIDMRGHSDLFDRIDMDAMAMEVVRRSEGRLEEFYAECLGSDEVMSCIADRTTRLRCLCLISTDHISDEGLVQAVRACPNLEELEITLCSFSSEIVELVGLACPQLKKFRLNKKPYMIPGDSGSDVDAFAIGKHMRQLCQLQLFGNKLTNVGLLAILDNCPYLEYLDICRCLHVWLDENLKMKCARIKDVRLPSHSTADYKFDPTIAHLGTSYTDNDLYLSDTDYDLLLDGNDYDGGYESSGRDL